MTLRSAARSRSRTSSRRMLTAASSAREWPFDAARWCLRAAQRQPLLRAGTIRAATLRRRRWPNGPGAPRGCHCSRADFSDSPAGRSQSPRHYCQWQRPAGKFGVAQGPDSESVRCWQLKLSDDAARPERACQPEWLACGSVLPSRSTPCRLRGCRTNVDWNHMMIRWHRGPRFAAHTTITIPTA